MPARRPIHRQSVMHDCIVIRFSPSSHSFIGIQHRPEAIFDRCTLQWYAMLLAKFLHCTETIPMERGYSRKLFLAQHRHFGLAAPTPKHSHDG